MSEAEPSTIIMVSSAYCRRETPPPSYKVWDHAVNVAEWVQYSLTGKKESA